MGNIRWLLACLLLSALAPLGAGAQQAGTIQGTVVDAATGRPLAGAQVRVQGSSLGTLSNDQGRFQLVNVPAGSHFVRAEVIGYAAAERTVTVRAGVATALDFALSQSAVELEGLVVTALGIERQERTLTTATQQIRGETLTEAPEPNLVAALTGRVSGVTITNSNTPGGSSRIVIRGANSLTGNNQPLFVVDGTPVSNSDGSGAPGSSGYNAGVTGRMGYNAIDYGNAIQDINPNDVESITVLKGPNAAALYGSRAANGAILITTRSGRRARGTGVTASSTITFESPLRLPEYQNLYGQGSNGRFRYENGRGGGVYDDNDESWGPRLDGRMIPQFFSNGEPAPWVPSPNNVRDFFETGRTANTAASFAASSDRANVRLSAANLNEDGMYPGFGMDRTTVSFNGGAELTSRLRADGSVQYINSDAENRPAQGYGADNVMWQFLWFGRQVDTGLLRDRLYNEDGTQFNWNNRWNNNPYWTSRVNRNWDARDRVIGSGSLTYRVTPWLNALVRSGTDWYQENRVRTFAAGTIGQSGVDANGAFGEVNAFGQEINTDFLLSTAFPRRGNFSLNGNFGGNRRDERYRAHGSYVRNLVVPGLFDLGNAAVTPELSDWREAKRVNSLYGSMQFGFRDLWFVDVTGRNDWSSTLPENNNSYFYPSVSTSLILTELVDLPGLDYAKVRAGWAEVGNDAAAYQLRDPYVADTPFDGAPRYTASNRLRNFDLKPEITDSWEVGAELRFLDDRFGVDLTYYSKATSNQIIPVQITPMTGFSERMLNAGKISNRGVELLVDATPIRLANGLAWEMTANFSRNESRVDELYGDLETIVLGTYYGVSVQARKGEPYGQMYGRQYRRDDQGNIVVNPGNGRPYNDSGNPTGLLGNYNPDWSAGLSNRLSFRGLELSALVDTRQGGSIYSLTSAYGRRSGVLIETLQGRENSPDDSLLVAGVYPNGQPNTRKTTAQLYHRGLTGLHEQFVFDASFVKLRELRLGYAVPSSLTGRLGVAGMRLALVGRNLALWTDVPHIDPETAFNAGNVQGFEYSQMPSARSIGFTIDLTP